MNNYIIIYSGVPEKSIAKPGVVALLIKNKLNPIT